MKTSRSLRFVPALNLLTHARFLNAFVSICMILQSTPMASAANAPEVLAGSVSLKSIQALAIPKEMGSVSEIFRGESRTRILCIEDAHSVTEAQENIRKMIGHLQTRYGVALFAAEGGVGKFDPTLYRAFPDAKRKEKVFSADLTRSEITGTEAAALLNEKEAAFYGIEDWELYASNFKAYLKVSSAQKGLLEVLGRSQENLRRKRDAVFAEPLRQFHRVLENFYDEKASLAELLVEMIPHQNLLGGGKEYAELSLMMRAAALEQKAEDPDLRVQITAMAREMKEQYLRKMDLKTQMRFFAALQSFMTGQIDNAGFLLELVRLAQPFGYRPRLTPVMKVLLGDAVTLSRIRGSEALGALESSVMRVEEALSTNSEERKLIGEYHRFFFMKNFVQLRVSRSQFLLFEKNPAIYTHSFDSAFRKAVEPAAEYYRIALKRDQAFLSRLEKVMRETRRDIAGVVLGGFHTQGLTDLLREKKIAFAVLTPRIRSLKGEELYGNIMRGDLSYREDLKTSFYDGYARSTVRKLVEDYDAFDLRRVVSLWRDDLIRTLSEQGRVADFHRYALYFEEIIKDYPSPSSFNEQKTSQAIFTLAEKELEQCKKETLRKVRTRFQSQLRAFTAGLGELWQRKQMTETAVDSLYKNISNPQASFLNLPTTKLIFDAPGRGDFVFEFMAGNRSAFPGLVPFSPGAGHSTAPSELSPPLRSEIRKPVSSKIRPAPKTAAYSGFYRRGLMLLKIAGIMAVFAAQAFGAQVRLAWDSPTDTNGTVLADLAGFKVYSGEASGNYSQVWNAGNTNDFLVTNLVMGVTYYFTATAYNTAQNESDYARPELVWTAPFPAPSGLVVSNGTNGNASLNWIAMGDPSVAGYRIRHTYPDGRAEQTDVGMVTDYVWKGTVTNLGIHSFTIAGINSRGTEGEKSAAVTYVADVVPEVPVLTGASARPGSIDLRWDLQPGIAGYRIYRGESPGVYDQSWDAGATNGFQITGLVSGVEYYFMARSYNGKGEESAASGEMRHAVPLLPPPDFRIANATNQSIMLSWQDSNDESITGYRIFHKYPDQHTASNDVGKVTEFNWTGTLADLGEHSFWIASINSRGMLSGVSPTVSRTVDVIPQTPVINVLTSAFNSVTLAWDFLQGHAGYKIFQGEISGVYTQLWDAGNTNQFMITNLVSGITNYFVAASYNRSGAGSGYSAPALSVVLPLLPPVDFRIAGATNHNLTLSWQMSGDSSVTGYRIYHKYPNNRIVTRDVAKVTVTTFANSTLVDPGDHSFWVVSRNSRNLMSSQSPVLVWAVALRPQAPLPSVMASSPDSITLTWTPPTLNANKTPLVDLAGYKIFRGERSGVYTQSWDVGNTTQFQVTNLVSGINNYFVMVAYNKSEQMSILSSPALLYKIPLLPPNNFSVSSVTNKNITLSWQTSNDPNVVGYRIYHTYPDMRTGSRDVGKLTQYTWANILSGTGDHSFKIASRNSRGIISAKSTAIVWTVGTPSLAVQSTLPAMTGLSIVPETIQASRQDDLDSNPKTVTLRIQASSEKVVLRFLSAVGTDYEIQWTDDLVSNSWTALEVISGTGEEIVWEEMMQGDRGFYRVIPQEANTVSAAPRSEMRVGPLTDGLAQITSYTDLLRDVSYFVSHGRTYWLYDLRQVNGEINADLIAFPADWHQRLQRNDVLTYRRHELNGFYFKPTMTQVKGQRVKEDAGVLMATKTVKGVWDAIDKIRPAGISAKTLQKMDSALYLQARKYRIPLIPFWREKYPDLASAQAGLKQHVQNELRRGERAAFSRSLREALNFFRMNEAEWRKYFENEIRAKEEALAEQRVLRKTRANEVLPAWPQSASWQKSFDYMRETISYLAGISNSTAWVLSASGNPEIISWGEWSSHVLSTPLTLLSGGYHFYQKGAGRKFVLEGSLTIVESLERRLEEIGAGIVLLSEMARAFSNAPFGDISRVVTRNEKGKSPESALKRDELFKYFAAEVFSEDAAGNDRREKFIQAARALEKGYREIAKQTEAAIADLESYFPKKVMAAVYPNSTLRDGMLIRMDGGEYWIYDTRNLADRNSLTLWKRRRHHALREEDRKVVRREELNGASVISRGTSRLTLRGVEELLNELPEEARNKKALSEGPFANPKLYYAVVTYRYPLPASSPTVERQEEMGIGQPPAEMSPEVFRSPFTAWIPIRHKDLPNIPEGRWSFPEREWERIGEQKMEALSAQIDRGNSRVLDFLKDNVYLIFTLDAERFGTLSGGLPEAPRFLNRLKELVGRHSFLRAEIQGPSAIALESLTTESRFLLEHPEAFARAYEDWQRANAASGPVVIPRVEATVLDAAFLSVLADSRDVETFCAAQLAAGGRLMLAYDRQNVSGERIVRSLLSKFAPIVPFAYLYKRNGREISDRNLAKRLGTASYVALFPVSAGVNIKVFGNSTLAERSALADETFIKKVVQTGTPLERVFSIVQVGLLRGQLEDRGGILKELTPRAFNRIVQFLNWLAETYKVEKVLRRAA